MKYWILLLSISICFNLFQFFLKKQEPIIAEEINNHPKLPLKEEAPFRKRGNLLEVQVNRIPHPLSLDGRHGFALWVDGIRFPINSHQNVELARFLDINYTRPNNTKDIHDGKGWLYPLNVGESVIQN